jgi:hypothetical protein
VSAISQELQAAVCARAANRCEYCLFPQDCSLAVFEVDHVTPRSQGGLTALNNLALACPLCNAHKWAHQRGIDPTSGESVLLFDPRTQIWHEHFRWASERPFEIEGVTPCGRVTVMTLRMNDPRIVALREAFSKLGLPIKPSI